MLSVRIIVLFLSLSSVLLAQGTVNRKVAVTMDDLPLQRIEKFSTEKLYGITAKIIEKIKLVNAPVVGFVNGVKLQTEGKYDESKIDLLKMWLNAGLTLGNHTYAHKSANAVPVKEYEEDILKGEAVLKETVENGGAELIYFRHPYLQTGRSLEVKNEIDNFLKDHNYIIVPVTIDNSEWIYASAYDKAVDSNSTGMMKKIGDEYLRYMKAKLDYWESQSNALFGRNINHILLIHANTLNSDYYDQLCGMIKDSGYKFISVDEALSDPAYKSEDNFKGAGGISWIHRWAITQKKGKEFFGNEPVAPDFIMKYAGVESE